MNRALIIHAWDESPQACWYTWLKYELEARGYDVMVPAMPEPDVPKIEPWVATLQQLLPNPNEDVLLVGHSVGCQAILRYMAELSDEQSVGQVILVAPWTHLINLDPESQQIAKLWLETPLDWDKIKAHCGSFVALFSDDDEWVPLTEEKIFREKLGAETRVLHQMGHFDAVDTLQEVLRLVQ